MADMFASKGKDMFAEAPPKDMFSPDLGQYIHEDGRESVVSYLTADRQDALRAKGPIGWQEAWNRQQKLDLLPFSASAVARNLATEKAVKRLQANEYNEDGPEGDGGYQRIQDEKNVADFWTKFEEEQIRGYSYGGKFVRGVSIMPGFMLEFAMTGGLASIGKALFTTGAKVGAKKLAITGVKKGIKRKLMKGAVGMTGGAVARTPVMAHRYMAKYGEHQIHANIAVTDKGMSVLDGTNESPAKSFLRAVSDTFIEVWSETLGEGMFKPLGKHIGGKVSKSLSPEVKAGINKFMGRLFAKGPGKVISGALKKGGFDGIIEEIGEEVVGDQLRAAFGVEAFGVEEGRDLFNFDKMAAAVPGWDDLAVMAGIFAVPGGVSLAASRIEPMLKARGLNSKEIKEFKDNTTQTEQEALLEEFELEDEGWVGEAITNALAEEDLTEEQAFSLETIYNAYVEEGKIDEGLIPESLEVAIPAEEQIRLEKAMELEPKLDADGKPVMRKGRKVKGTKDEFEPDEPVMVPKDKEEFARANKIIKNVKAENKARAKEVQRARLAEGLISSYERQTERFKSNVEAVVTQLPDLLMKPKDIMRVLSEKLTKEEIEYTGLHLMLSLKDEYNKAEIVEFVQKNKVKVKVIRKSEEEGEEDENQEEIDERYYELRQDEQDQKIRDYANFEAPNQAFDYIWDEAVRQTLEEEGVEVDAEMQMLIESARDGNVAARDQLDRKLDALDAQSIDSMLEVEEESLIELYREQLDEEESQEFDDDLYYQAREEVENDRETEDTTKHATYQLNDAPDEYEEILLQVDKSYKDNIVELEMAIARKKFSKKSNPTEAEKIAHANELHDLERKLEFERKISFYFTNHFDEADLLVHIRLNTRVDLDGRSSLFIEEVQSDVHKSARRKVKKEKGDISKAKMFGYKSFEAYEKIKDKANALAKENSVPGADTISYGFFNKEDLDYSDDVSFYNALERLYEDIAVGEFAGDIADARKKITEWKKEVEVLNGSPIDMPFKEIFYEMSIKEAIHMAVENGQESVSWVNGKQQGERWNLRMAIEYFEYKKAANGTYSIFAKVKGNRSDFKESGMDEDRLEEVMGSEWVDRIKKGEGDELPEGESFDKRSQRLRAIREEYYVKEIKYEDGNNVYRIWRKSFTEDMGFMDVPMDQQTGMEDTQVSSATFDTREAAEATLRDQQNEGNMERGWFVYEYMGSEVVGSKYFGDDFDAAVKYRDDFESPKQKEDARRFSGEDLEMGHEWALRVYDDIIPGAAKKLIAQWGGKIEMINFGDNANDPKNEIGKQEGFYITPMMKLEFSKLGKSAFGNKLAGDIKPQDLSGSDKPEIISAVEGEGETPAQQAQRIAAEQDTIENKVIRSQKFKQIAEKIGTIKEEKKRKRETRLEVEEETMLAMMNIEFLEAQLKLILSGDAGIATDSQERKDIDEDIKFQKNILAELKELKKDLPAEVTVKEREITRLKRRLSDYSQGVLSGRIKTKEDIKKHQNLLKQMIVKSKLPAKDINKLLPMVTKVDSATSLHLAIKDYERRAEIYHNREDRVKLDGLIADEYTFKTKKSSSREANVITGESHDLIQYLKGVLNEANYKAEDMLKAYPEDQNTPMDLVKKRMLSYSANGAETSVELRQAVLDDIIHLKALGRSAVSEASFNYMVERAYKLDNALMSLKKSKASEKSAKTKAMNGYRRGWGNIYSILNATFGKKFADEYDLQLAESRRDTAVFEKAREMGKVLSGIYDGKSHLDVINDLAKQTFTLRGKDGIDQEINTFQLIDIYLSLKNDITRDRYSHNFGEDQIAGLVRKLEKKELYIADYLQSVVQGYREVINKNKLETTGEGLGFIENYWPATTEREEDFFEGFAVMSEIPTAAQKRSASRMLQPRPVDAWSKAIKHITQAEHINHLSRPYEQLKRILNSVMVKKLFKSKYGKGTQETLNHLTDHLSLQGVTSRLDLVSQAFGGVLNNWVIAKIALNPTVLAKQLISTGNFIEQMPADEWVKGFIEGLKNPIKTFKFMWNAVPYLESRFNRGATEAQGEALRGAESVGKNWHNWTMFLSSWVRSGDITAIIFGGYPLVKYTYEQAKKEDVSNKVAAQRAIDAFELATISAQQSQLTSSRSEWQNSKNPFARLYLAFKNTSNQYFRKMVDASVMYYNKDITALQYAKVMTIYGIINPVLFASTGVAISSALLGIGGDDDDVAEKFAKAILVQLIMTPFNAIPVMDDVSQFAARKLTGQKAWQVFGTPLFDDLEQAFRIISKDGITGEDWIKLTATVLEVSTATPVHTYLRMYKKVTGG